MNNHVQNTTQAATQQDNSSGKFPSAFTILFGLIIGVAAMTWIVPAGQYDKQFNPTLDKEVPVPGTYHTVDPNPQGFADVVLAPIAGFYNPESYQANAIDVALFILIIGGFLGVVNKTGAIDAGIGHIMRLLRGREIWMIPILMSFFAAGGTIYGMAEETLAFYMLIIPVIIAAGYDALTAVAIIMIGAGMGTLGSTINPFATVIASNAAGISFTDGIYPRLFILITGWLACVAYVMRYAHIVKQDPSRSLVADLKTENEGYFLNTETADKLEPSTTQTKPDANFTLKHRWVLFIFVTSFVVMIWGVSSAGWWMAKMSGLFLVASIVVGFVAQIDEKKLVADFIDGAKDLLGVALIIGVARGIVVVMDAGYVTDTILYWSEQAVSGLPNVAFINTLFGLQILLSFFVPSSSGLAVLTMPVVAPLADFVGVGRDLVVTAFQCANGLVNLVNPTFAVVMGGLAIGRVPYDRWLKFIWPLLLLLPVIIMATLSYCVVSHT